MMTPEQGFTAYLQLDGPRTLDGLRQKLMDNGADPPTLHWFQKWGAKSRAKRGRRAAWASSPQSVI